MTIQSANAITKWIVTGVAFIMVIPLCVVGFLISMALLHVTIALHMCKDALIYRPLGDVDDL